MLTPAGHRLLLAALPIWRRAHAKIEKLLDDPDALRRRPAGRCMRVGA